MGGASHQAAKKAATAVRPFDRLGGSLRSKASFGPRRLQTSCMRKVTATMRPNETGENPKVTLTISPRRIITGNAIREARLAKNLTQSELATRCQTHRNTVANWEKRTDLGREAISPANALARILAEVGILHLIPVRAHGGMGCYQMASGFVHRPNKMLKGKSGRREKEAQRAASLRVLCEAKTRKGHPCKNMSVPGRRRCKFHGGLSTGPKTIAGRERIAEAQRRRWARPR